MKKFIFLIASMFLTCISTLAVDIIPETIYAISPTQYNFEAEKTINLVAINDSDSEKLIINKDDNLSIKLLEYVAPKRGKRNGYYKIKLLKVNSSNIAELNFVGSMKIFEEKDKKALAEKAGSTAISLTLLPGFSQGYAIAKGVVAPNEEETRMKSIGENLYNSTPLPLLKKGKEFNIDKNSVLVLKFRDKN